MVQTLATRNRMGGRLHGLQHCGSSQVRQVLGDAGVERCLLHHSRFQLQLVLLHLRPKDSSLHLVLSAALLDTCLLFFVRRIRKAGCVPEKDEGS